LAGVDWRDVWSSLSSRGVKDVLEIIDLIRALPATSVPNEVAFNQMKLIKTSRRQRISNSHLNDCMVIRSNSESIDKFDPTPAIDNWMVTTMNVYNLIKYDIRSQNKSLPRE
jgi:hypothetical protein